MENGCVSINISTSVLMIVSHLLENIQPGAQANPGVCYIAIVAVLPPLTWIDSLTKIGKECLVGQYV